MVIILCLNMYSYLNKEKGYTMLKIKSVLKGALNLIGASLLMYLGSIVAVGLWLFEKHIKKDNNLEALPKTIIYSFVIGLITHTALWVLLFT